MLAWVSALVKVAHGRSVKAAVAGSHPGQSCRSPIVSTPLLTLH